MTVVNPQDEIDEVRSNCGGTSESNLPEADIDIALSEANEEATERTGLTEDDPHYPYLRRKMKLLIATAYLLIRFSNMVDTRASILKEIEDLTKQMTELESTDEFDESLFDSVDSPSPGSGGITTDSSDAQQINFWNNGTHRSGIPVMGSLMNRITRTRIGL